MCVLYVCACACGALFFSASVPSLIKKSSVLIQHIWFLRFSSGITHYLTHSHQIQKTLQLSVIDISKQNVCTRVCEVFVYLLVHYIRCFHLHVLCPCACISSVFISTVETLTTEVCHSPGGFSSCKMSEARRTCFSPISFHKFLDLQAAMHSEHPFSAAITVVLFIGL